MNKPELKPCPFCGAPAKFGPRFKRMPHHIVGCSHDTEDHRRRGNGCPAITAAFGNTPEEAAARWNGKKVPGKQSDTDVTITRPDLRLCLKLIGNEASHGLYSDEATSEIASLLLRLRAAKGGAA